MASKPSVKIVYKMPYRGHTQEWSNRYHFDPAVPANDAAWEGFFDDLLDDMAYLVPATGTLDRMVGYLAGSDVPVYSKLYDETGTADYDGSDISCPGDVAALSRFSTTQRTSKNHPIYLFKYMHQAMHQTGTPDTISAHYKSHLELQLGRWVSGHYTVSGTPVNYCGPHGAVAQDVTVETYLTHRDFPR